MGAAPAAPAAPAGCGMLENRLFMSFRIAFCASLRALALPVETTTDWKMLSVPSAPVAAG